MAETVDSTAASQSVTSPSSPTSPRRPSLDNIVPNVPERIERYMRRANQHLAQMSTFGDTDEDEYHNLSDTMKEANSLNTNLSAPSPVSNFSFDENNSNSNGVRVCHHSVNLQFVITSLIVAFLAARRIAQDKRYKRN